MGTALGSKIVRIYQPRNGKRIFTGMVDEELRLYSWAPGDGQSIKNFVWDGCMSFGIHEWETLLRLGVKRLEFKDPNAGLIWRASMKRAKRFIRRDQTKHGPRMLLPLGCFRVLTVDGEVTKDVHRRYR